MQTVTFGFDIENDPVVDEDAFSSVTDSSGLLAVKTENEPS